MIPNRIELAARALCNEGVTVNGVWRCQRDTSACRDCRDEAMGVLRAAFPELFTDPPQVWWLAPVNATEEMAKAIWDCPADEANRAWAAFRDAHLASQSDKPEKGEAK